MVSVALCARHSPAVSLRLFRLAGGPSKPCRFAAAHTRLAHKASAQQCAVPSSDQPLAVDPVSEVLQCPTASTSLGGSRTALSSNKARKPGDQQQQRCHGQHPDEGEMLERRRRWKQHRTAIVCPACGQRIFRFEVFQRHAARCCADLLRCDALGAAESDVPALERLLEQAQAEEWRLRELSLRIAFHSVDEATHQRVRLGPQDIAQQLGLPPDRAERLLRAAMRGVPLVRDEVPVEVLFEDEHLVAVNKPPGLITAPKHRFAGGSLVNRLIHHLDGAEPLVCHRLDMNTSGVVLFAKTKQAVADVHKQFRERRVTKRYLALAVGEGLLAGRQQQQQGGRVGPPPPGQQSPQQQQHLLVDAPIGRHPTHEVARMVCGDGQAASTDLWVLRRSGPVERQRGGGGGAPAADLASLGATAADLMDTRAASLEGATLVCAAPRTGRTHQIRVHLAHVGHPILGDDIYGMLLPQLLPRQALHAAALQLQHPATGQPLRVTAPLPEDIRLAADRLGLLSQQGNGGDGVLDSLLDLQPPPSLS